MQKKKKVLVLLTIASSSLAITVAASFIGKGSGFRSGVGADACAVGQHSGNHYLANAATCGEAGNAEFWACCECQQQFLSNPGGNFADCGAYAGAPLASTHIAYVAPTGEHAYGYHATVNEGVAYLVESCNDCGVVHGDPIKQMDVGVNATFEHDLTGTSDGYRWAQDATTGVWRSTNQGKGSSSNYLFIKVLTAGVLKFDYTSSGEGGFDYMYFGPNTNESEAYVNCKGNGTDERNVSGSYSKDVVENERIVFTFKKDSSGNKGDDCGTVKFIEGTFTYKALTLNTNGGDACEPMFLESGKIVGDLPTPVKAGSFFKGWYIDPELSTPVTATSTFEGDATIYAKWTDAATVTLNANGGTCAASVNFEPGTTPEIPTPTKDGHYFIGWFTDPELTVPYVSGVKSESFALYAKWLAESEAHELYGNYGGFKFKPSSYYAPTDSYTQLAVDVDGAYKLRTAYAAYDEGTLGTVSDGKVSASSNGTAQVFENKNIVVMHEGSAYDTSKYYYVMFKGSDATKAGTNDSSVKSFDKVTFVKFVYNSNDVIMMIDNATGLASYNVSIVNSLGNAITYTDLRSSNEATMYFIVKSAGGDVIKTLGYGDSSSKLLDTFTGVRGTFTSADSKSITFSGNGKAVFSVIGSSSVATVTDGGADNTYIVANGTSYYTVTVNPLDNTFTYVKTVATLTFDANGGHFSDSSTTKEAQVDCGAWYNPRTKVEEPTKEGCIFKGWWREGSTQGETWVQTKVSAETFTAHWVTGIDVTIHYNNGAEDKTVTYEENSSPEIETPEYEGKAFVCWCTDAELNNTWDGIVTASTTDIYAKYKDVPVFVGTFYGFNSDHDGIQLYNENSKDAYPGQGYSFTAEGAASGRSSTTWSAENYDATTGELILGNNSKVMFAKASDGTLFEFCDYTSGSSWYCDDDMCIAVKSKTAPTFKEQTLCWLNGCQKISKVTVNGTAYLIYINGYHETNNPFGGKAYVDVTFKDGSGNPLDFADLASKNPVSFAREINIYKGDTLVGACGGDGTTLVMNDMKGGTYTGIINGESGSIVLNGYGVANVTIGAAAAVEGTYKFETESLLKVTIGENVYSFNVEGFNLTQILDGYEGVYTADDGKTITLTGYGVASVKVGEAEPVAGTYKISQGNVYVTVGEDVTGYSVDVANKTLTKLAPYTVTNSGSSASYKWVYNSDTNTWTSNNQNVGSSYCEMKITANVATTVVVTYWASSESESRWDYFHIDKNGTQLYNAGGTTMTADDAVTQTIELAAGDVLILKYQKDSSGKGGSDTAYMTKLEINGVQYVG